MIIVGGDYGIRLYEKKVQLMIYVGIGIAKLNHFASAISSDSEIIIEPFKFTNDNDGFQLLISKFELLDSQLERVEAEMTDIMEFNDSVIMAIPGIGFINGGMILGEMVDIHRFSSSNSIDNHIFHL